MTGDVDQIIGDHPEADPAGHAVEAMIPTAALSVATFEYADPAFAADAPALSAPEPALVGASLKIVHSDNGRTGGSWRVNYLGADFFTGK